MPRVGGKTVNDNSEENQNTLVISKSPAGSFRVRVPGFAHLDSLFDTKAEALAYAKKYAKRIENGEVKDVTKYGVER